ncbi:hook-length control protein FliK [Collimonas sp. OK607]|uniref:flagellar hook-length control protein FliK n=1 Tax=Collimonas sp. OK607 TaxID=1798194 RepID=UPI0008E18612|nr:flagellar hook-length control protein FliK [Collimonas sp. OK607]SFB22477.1 hook-length control protein FliK [Collimonas sp. OK607]
MSGGTPLIDKVLATAPMQRSDLVPLKGQLAIYAPDATTDIEAIANDTRLPSRAAVDRQLGVDLGQPVQPGVARLAPGVADGASLSAAARVISELLGSAPAKGEPVRGSAPLWPATAAQEPEPQQLSAALARSVADSGLFYESHLLQFFSGQRSLAQLLQEPQAHLRLQLAAAETPATASSPVTSHVAASIAADAIPLVRQQLELLALSQFRWSGEAWPGAGMEWEVTEQGRRQQGGADSNNPHSTPPTWSTRVSMTLPRLGSIELRLSLVNDRWRADLGAAEVATMNAMRADSGQLRQRFSAAGLPLGGLEVAQLPQAATEDESDKKNVNKSK